MHPQPLGSIPKDSRKMVANWLVKLLGSTVGSAMARVGVMSIGYDLKEIAVGSHNQSRQLSTGHRH
jgi:hypothetical protein